MTAHVPQTKVHHELSGAEEQVLAAITTYSIPRVLLHVIERHEYYRR